MRLFLRRFRSLPFLPISLARAGHPRLAVWWGHFTRQGLLAAMRRGWPRHRGRVYLPAATFAAGLLEPGDVFIDVGAYDGLITIIGAEAVGSAGHVYAFEPTPASCTTLRALVRSSHLAQVHVEETAVGATDGTTTFNVPADPAMAFYATLSTQPAVETVPHVCRVQTLDTFAQTHLRPTLIKIDVEGAELDVLRGAIGLLSAPQPPLVIFEASAFNAALFQRSVDDVLTYLASFGYVCWILRPPILRCVTRATEINPADDPALWTDVLAMHPDVHHAGFVRLRRRLRLSTDVGRPTRGQ